MLPGLAIARAIPSLKISSAEEKQEIPLNVVAFVRQQDLNAYAASLVLLWGSANGLDAYASNFCCNTMISDSASVFAKQFMNAYLQKTARPFGLDQIRCRSVGTCAKTNVAGLQRW